jgi:regulatory protein
MQVPRREPDTMPSDPGAAGPSGGIDPSGDVDPSGGAGLGVASDPEAVGRQICLRLLTTEPRTRAQLGDAMRRRGVPEETADAILDHLADAGLVDDAAFAKAWVESRHYARGLSRRSLSTELRRRGVGGDDITEAVETLDSEQETDTARQLVTRKLRSTRGQPAAARARRVASMLARKGYPAGLAFRLIREALEQEGAEDLEVFDDLDADGFEVPEQEGAEDSAD